MLTRCSRQISALTAPKLVNKQKKREFAGDISTTRLFKIERVITLGRHYVRKQRGFKKELKSIHLLGGYPAELPNGKSQVVFLMFSSGKLV